MAERIREVIWWPSIDKDVREHVEKCPSCGACPHNTQTPAKADGNLPQCQAPNQRVHVDLFGPLKTSQGGHKFVLVYTDAFTRLCRLMAIPDKSASTVADAILQWLYLFGIPKAIVSDQGKEFCNKLAEHLYRALQIEHKMTTPYHPQCNSSAERFNRTMVNFLRRAILDSENSESAKLLESRHSMPHSALIQTFHSGLRL